jgi:hypothetical protein
MYTWSRDRAYIEDPAFTDFYDRTVSDYVERWGLALDQIMKRPRLLNVRGMPDAGKKFQAARGIPGYDEGDKEYTLGIDVLATQYVAYLGYAYIQEARGRVDLGRAFRKKAADVRTLVNTTWWNEKEQYFYGRLGKDQKLSGRGGGSLLYRDIVDEPKVKSALNDGRGSPEVLYRYGDHDAAHDRMLEIAFGARSRREYPEVPFSWSYDRGRIAAPVRHRRLLGGRSGQDLPRPRHEGRMGGTSQPAASV